MVWRLPMCGRRGQILGVTLNLAARRLLASSPSHWPSVPSTNGTNGHDLRAHWTCHHSLRQLHPQSTVGILALGGSGSPSLDLKTLVTTPSSRSTTQISTLANGHGRSMEDDHMEIQVAWLIKVRENPARISLRLRVHR